jgi:hypothetical protein
VVIVSRNNCMMHTHHVAIGSVVKAGLSILMVIAYCRMFLPNCLILMSDRVIPRLPSWLELVI